jgi:DNA-binding response OmpR family regulator
MNLRKKIEADPRRPERLLTVYGVGYKLAGDENPRRGT